MSNRKRLAILTGVILVIAAVATYAGSRVAELGAPAQPARPTGVLIHGWFDNLGLGEGPCVHGGDRVVITSRDRHVAATATLPRVGQQVKIQGVTAIRYAWSARVQPAKGYGVTAGSLPPYEAGMAELRKGLELSC